MPSPKLFFAHHQLPASQTSRRGTHLVLEGRGEGSGGSTLLGRGEGGGAGNEGGEGSKLEHGCAIIGHKVSAIDIVLEPPPCCAMALVGARISSRWLSSSCASGIVYFPMEVHPTSSCAFAFETVWPNGRTSGTSCARPFALRQYRPDTRVLLITTHLSKSARNIFLVQVYL